MKAPNANPNQGCLLKDDLLEHLNPKNPYLLLADKIPWEVLERELEPLYAEGGRPAKPVRLMCGLLILKRMESLSDDHLMERWVQNPYFQVFCGERVFQWQPPCAASDLSHFRERVGEEGAEKIFAMSVFVHGEKVLE